MAPSSRTLCLDPRSLSKPGRERGAACPRGCSTRDAGASSKLNVGKPHAAETCHGRDLPGRRRRLTLGNPRCSSNKQTKGINPRASHRHRKRSLKQHPFTTEKKQLSKVVKETSYLRGSDSPKPTQTSFPEEKRQQRRPLKPGTATRTPASPPSSKQAAGPDRLSGHVGQKGSDLTSRAAEHEGTARGPAPSAASTVPRMAGRPLTSASTAVTSSTKRFPAQVPQDTTSVERRQARAGGPPAACTTLAGAGPRGRASL